MGTLFTIAFFFLILGVSQRVAQVVLATVLSRAHMDMSNTFADRAFVCEAIAVGFLIAGVVSILVS